MVKPKRVLKVKRIKRFSSKNVSWVTASRFRDQINRMVILLQNWLICQDLAEKDTIARLKELEIPEEKHQYYIAYIKEVMNRTFWFTPTTLDLEKAILVDEWVKRGLDQAILEEIKPIGQHYGLEFFKTYKLLPISIFDMTEFDNSLFWD